MMRQLPDSGPTCTWVQDKREKVFMGDSVYHKVHTKDVLDPTFWTYDKFRSTMHGHINADNEDATYKPREMIAM